MGNRPTTYESQDVVPARSGSCLLVPHDGLSIISDIDDTIKVNQLPITLLHTALFSQLCSHSMQLVLTRQRRSTQITDVLSKRELIRNTFLREFTPVPGMAGVYTSLYSTRSGSSRLLR